MKAADTSSGKAARIPELDGVRGVAIAMVLAHHYFLLPIRAPLATWPSYIQAAGRLAWSGVDLFFVLSGFLLGGILLEARDSSNYFSVFYARRFLRIVPIYFVCLSGGLLLTVLFDHGLTPKLSWMFESPLPLRTYFIFLQNLWMAKRTTYGMFGLGVTWSLAIEEQFYLTLPWLIRVCRRDGALVVALLAGIAVAPLSRLTLHVLYPEHALAGVVLMPCRADALLLGVFGAVLIRKSSWKIWLERHRKLLVGSLCLLACGFVVLTKYFPNPYGFGMVSFGFTYLAFFYLMGICYAVLFPDSVLGGILRWRWLRWLGSIAFGVYLFHELIRSLFFGVIWSHLPTRMHFAELCVSLLALGFTLLLCHFSWRLFEKPLVDIGHHLNYDHGKRQRKDFLFEKGADDRKEVIV